MSTPEETKSVEDSSEDPASKRAKLEADVAKSANRVMKHMNDDHEDSLVAYVLAFATGVEGTDPEKDKEEALLQNILKGKLPIASAQLTAVDVDGFLLEVQAMEEDTTHILSNVRVPYNKPIESAKDLHHTAVAMHREAFDKLGFVYKAKNGYYTLVLKMVAFKSYSVVKKSAPPAPVVAGVAAMATAVAVAGYLRKRSK